MTWWRKLARQALAVGLCVLLGFGVVGCGSRSEPALSGDRPADRPKAVAGRLSEVAPPETIQELRQVLERYQPQVSILSPRANETLQDNQVSVRFQVRDLPIYKDERFELGPHLHVILDNQPYEAVYNLETPLVLSDLEPGTHTLRVFASRPWHESFKNEGAYAQVTFHVFAPTPNNDPAAEQPLLTYSRPKGTYGAEPIMLDFYLRNAPLHFIAQEDPADNISDWKIRCTINGESFTFDAWQPIYLKGFEPGKNWVKLELIDEKGNLIDNAFNSTVRLITYEPNGQDTLSRIVRGELSAAAVRSIVDPNAEFEAVEPLPEAIPTPEPSPIPLESPSPEPFAPPVPLETPTPSPEPEIPALTPPAPEVPTAAPEPEPAATPEMTEPTESETPESLESNEPAAPETAPQPEGQKSGGFFNRFRRAPKPVEEAPAPLPPTLPEVIEQPDLESIKEEVQAEPPAEPTLYELLEESEPDTLTDETGISETRETNENELEPTAPEASPAPRADRSNGLFERFRKFRPAPSAPPTPEAPPTLPEIIETPLPERDASGQDAEIELAPAPDTDETPLDLTPAEPKTPQGGFFDRFFPRRSPTAPATIPEAPDATTPDVLAPSTPEPEQTFEPDFLSPTHEENAEATEEVTPSPADVESPAGALDDTPPQKSTNPFQRFFPRRSPANAVSPEPPPELELEAPEAETFDESPTLEEPTEEATPEAVPSPTVQPTAEPNSNPLGGFFKRFQPSSPTVKPGPEFTPIPLPDSLESPEAESLETEPVTEPEESPTPAIETPVLPKRDRLFPKRTFQPTPPTPAPEVSPAPEAGSSLGTDASETLDTNPSIEIDSIDSSDEDSSTESTASEGVTTTPDEATAETTPPSPADILRKYRNANAR